MVPEQGEWVMLLTEVGNHQSAHGEGFEEILPLLRAGMTQTLGGVQSCSGCQMDVILFLPGFEMD